MNRQRIRVIVLAVLLVAAGAYVWAQRAASVVKPAQTNAATKKPGSVTQPVKSPPPAVANTKSAAATTPVNAPRGPQPPAVPATKGPAPATAAAPKTAPAVAPKAASTVTPTPAPAPVAATPSPAVVVPNAPLASWQDRLQKGSYLSEKLRSRLPEGTDPLAASAGFRDLQQFVATATAAHNLKLDFEELKRRVITDRKGLAPAIDAMKKVASATIEEQRAEYEARGLVREAERQPLPPAPAAATKAAAKDQPKKRFRTQSGS